MFPALLAFGDCDALRASGLADLVRSEEALAVLAAAAGWTREAAWRALAQLPRMRELSLLILLVCPGACAPASIRSTTNKQTRVGFTNIESIGRSQSLCLHVPAHHRPAQFTPARSI